MQIPNSKVPGDLVFAHQTVSLRQSIGRDEKTGRRQHPPGIPELRAAGVHIAHWKQGVVRALYDLLQGPR